MSGVLRTVGRVAGLVAIAAGTVVAFSNPFTATFAVAAKVGAIAGAAAGLAAVGAQMLAPKPPVRGSITDITIGADQPSPYMIGETYLAGALVKRVSAKVVDKLLSGAEPPERRPITALPAAVTR